MATLQERTLCATAGVRSTDEIGVTTNIAVAERVSSCRFGFD